MIRSGEVPGRRVSRPRAAVWAASALVVVACGVAVLLSLRAQQSEISALHAEVSVLRHKAKPVPNAPRKESKNSERERLLELEGVFNAAASKYPLAEEKLRQTLTAAMADAQKLWAVQCRSTICRAQVEIAGHDELARLVQRIARGERSWPGGFSFLKLSENGGGQWVVVGFFGTDGNALPR